MSVAPSSPSPTRRPWFGSLSTWDDRLSALTLLGLLAAAIGLCWFGSDLSFTAQLASWSGWCAVVFVLLILERLGALKLFGPVLFYDMVRSARRGRYILMRCLYAGLLLFLIGSAFLTELLTYRGRTTSPQEAAAFAEGYFEVFMFVQLLAILLLTPVYVAGAIADEKDRKTLEFLLATDLRSREIVLSKLVSRLANLSLLVMVGLPVLSMVQFMGGVDPNLVLTGFVLTLLTMAGLGGLSILNSVWCKKPRDAIALTYVGVLAYYALSFLGLACQSGFRPPFQWLSWPLWFGDGAPTFSDAIDVFNTGNLLLLVARVKEAGFRGTIAVDLPGLLRRYAIFQIAVAGITTTWSVLRVRAIALQQSQGASKRRRGLGLFGRPRVGRLPMLWKEIWAEGGVRLNWMSWIVVAILVIVSLLPAALILYYYFFQPRYSYPGANSWRELAISMNIWVRTAGTCVGCLMLLAVAVRASTSISGERDRQTLDALLTSPLDSSDILLAKCLGSILSMRKAWLWLGVIWGLGMVTGGLHPLALPLVLGAWLVFAGFAAVLGSWFSIVSRTSLRATVWTLVSTVGLGVGHWLIWLCCGPVLAFSSSGYGGGRNVTPQRISEYLTKFQLGLTPPFSLGFLQFSGYEFENNYGRRDGLELLASCLFGLFVWLMLTIILWIGVNARFRAATNRLAFNEPEFSREGADAWTPPRARRPPPLPRKDR